jgi:hypothetical protein
MSIINDLTGDMKKAAEDLKQDAAIENSLIDQWHRFFADADAPEQSAGPKTDWDVEAMLQKQEEKMPSLSVSKKKTD